MSRSLSSFIARLMGTGSLVCCLIVLASFALFVVNQTSAAGIHQRNTLTSGSATGSASAGGEAARPHKGALRRLVDEAAQKLTSPFATLTSSSNSQWEIELVGTILALLLYGVVVRYVMRMFEIRI
jgi:hypothetical protein